MMLKATGIAAALVLAAGLASAIAAEDPIGNRQAMMKNTGAAIGVMAKMAKGESAFDAIQANLAMRTINNAAIGFVHLFPEGSETGMDTEASPKIWEDMAGFVEKAKAMQDVTADAIAFPAASLGDLNEQLGKLGETCNGCHETYRIKKS